MALNLPKAALVAALMLPAACGQQAPAPPNTETPPAAETLPATETPTAAAAEPTLPAGFDQSLASGPFGFRVESANAGSLGSVKVTTTGLSADTSPQEAETNGTVTEAHVADLDADGFPEVYVFTQAAGSGSYGAALGWAVNKGKSLTPIMIPDLPDDPKLLAGYMGHDRFQLTKDRLARSFPVYRDGDPNSAPSGGTRSFFYSLQPGEAGWKMVLVKTEAA